MTKRMMMVLLGLGLGLPLALSSNAVAFGVSKFTLQTTRPKEVSEEIKGQTIRNFINEPYVFTQAGGHPVALTATVELEKEPAPNDSHLPAGGDPKDVVVDLPQGLLGNPTAASRCALINFTRSGKCPAASQVGVAEVEFESSLLVEEIYNLEPEKGQSAEFGIPAGGGINVLLTAHVARADKQYVLTVVSKGIPMRGFTRFTTTFWGVPAASSNDPQRGRQCETNEVGITPIKCDAPPAKEGGETSGVAEVPFLTFPANCLAGPESASLAVDSWQQPGVYVPAPEAALPAATGCGALSFVPSLEISPDTELVSSPVGLGVDLEVPQPELPSVPSTPELRNASVTLPQGLSINPSSVNGIEACDESGPHGINFDGPESEQAGPDGEPQLAPGKCPNASIVGTATAVTPLLAEPVHGHLFLARPLCGGATQPPCTEEDARDGRLYRLYLELGGTGHLADTGVNIKAAGDVSANPVTGQLTSTFSDNPQLPFSQLKLELNGGAHASLANPRSCGEARTTADFTPWSSPGEAADHTQVAGTPDADPFSFYQVVGCTGPPGLAPGFAAQTTIPSAGGFSPFEMDLTRKDGEQEFAGIQLHTPPGLLGMLSSVPLCGEPEAQQGTCPESSRIGSTLVASGAGGDPFEIGGAVYLTVGYKGAPFGLSIVTHAVAGPFNLGLVVVRARIDVDPSSAALTVTSDPLPQIVFGVPLRLQRILVDIDRPGFMFNPTNCDGLQTTATIAGSQHAAAGVSSAFAAAGCRSLTFKPSFKVATNAHTSRKNGASLDVKLTFPAFKPGSDANVARVKVSLPKQLPSRLTTLQKSCPAAIFAANPAACPKGSIVGIARSSTPVLPVQLEGPVYFVSHGGEEFPSLIIVLQGDGVRVDLTAATFISKGITTSTLKTVPDVPVGSFELYLPQGPDSALAANGNLCKPTQKISVKRKVNGRRVTRTVVKPTTLTMPTEFIAQNKAVFKQATKIQVSGCKAPKAQGAKKGAKGAHATTRGRVAK